VGRGRPTPWRTCRISPASTPQEQLSSGSITNLNEFWVVLPQSASVPVNTGPTYYRLEVTHDIPGLTSPLPLYLKGTPSRSYEMLRKVLHDGGAEVRGQILVPRFRPPRRVTVGALDGLPDYVCATKGSPHAFVAPRASA
jgi:hypothetical protein